MRTVRAALAALSLTVTGLVAPALATPTAALAVPPALAAPVSLLAAPAAAVVDYNLLTNLPLAHTWRGALVADAAQTGFSRYARDMGSSWKQTTEDGRPVWLNDGVQANLWLPVDAATAKETLALEAVVKPLGSDQRLDVFIDDKKVASPALTDGFQLIRVPLDAGSVKAGFVKVRLHFRKSVEHKGTKAAVAVRAVRVGPASLAQLPAAEAELAALLARSQGNALNLPADGGLDYYMTPVKGQRLKGTATGTVEVWAEQDAGGPKKLGGGTGALDVDLASVAGKAIRLMLRGQGGNASLADARVGGGQVGAFEVKKPKYVVFWLIDTLRADKLPFYNIPNANGRPKVKTPNLSKLAAEGVVFEPFYVQGNESKSSHASLFTGTYPVVHGVYTHEASLSATHTTIAEAFKAAGFATAGYCSNGYVSDKWNYTQGFDEFVNFIREGKANNAQAVTNSAIKWIDKHLETKKDKPFYLYLGTSDPHVTYRKHDEFIGDYDKGAYSGKYEKSVGGDELGKLKAAKNPPSKRDQQRIEAIYENEIAFNDKHFGRLVAHLKAKGIYDDTLFIISADHGDEFWEHGSCGHGHNVHQELVNVPLVLRFPGAQSPGRVENGADGVDLLPTLMTLLGASMPTDVQGMNLLPYVGATTVHPTAVMASQGAGSYTLAVGPAKVIMRSPTSLEAYDIGADPGEKTDVFGKKLVTTMAALDPLLLYLPRKKTWKKAEHGAPNNLTPQFK